MANPTMKYAVVAVTAQGEWLHYKETNDCESAMEHAADELKRCQLRSFKPLVYCRAIGVDIMKRNAQGDYDGIASFTRS